jgi:hypothetical protein
MKQQNLLVNSLKYVAVDLVGSVLYWPIWWYTKGLIMVLKFLANSIKTSWFADLAGKLIQTNVCPI